MAGRKSQSGPTRSIRSRSNFRRKKIVQAVHRNSSGRLEKAFDLPPVAVSRRQSPFWTRH